MWMLSINFFISILFCRVKNQCSLFFFIKWYNIKALDLSYLGERNVLHHLNLEHVHPVHIALNLEVEPEAAGLEGFWRAGVIIVVGRWRQGGGPQLSHSDQVVAEVPGHVHLHVVDCPPICFLLSIQDLRLRKGQCYSREHHRNLLGDLWNAFSKQNLCF